MNKYDLAVIGGGPAGITLAKLLGKKMKLAIIRPEDYSMIYCAMPYAIEDIIPYEKTLKKDSLVTDAGMRPVTSIVDNTDIELGKDGIVVNNKMETNIPDVYAVGDCVQFQSGISGEIISGKLATNAVPMAKVLGLNLLGQNRTYSGFFNGAATKVGKYFVGGTGLTEKAAKASGYEVVCGYSEATTQFPMMPDAKKLRLKLVADMKTYKLLGAQIVSGESVTGRIDLLTFAIQKDTTIEELTSLSYSAQPYQSFFPAANIVVLAAEDLLKKINK